LVPPPRLFDAIRQNDAAGNIKRRSVGVSLSFAIHGALLAAAFAASYWAAQKKEEEPTKLTFFAPPPPPPPPPGGGATKKIKRDIPKVKKEFVQPKEVPKETPKQETKDDNPAGVEGGVEGGVVGGVVGGQVGGVLGGTGPTGQSLYDRASKLPTLKRGEEQPGIPGNLLPMLRGSKGIILAKIRIGRDGKVDSVEIVRSTMPLLEDILRKHIMSLVFEPTILGGRQVSIEVLQAYRFSF
jgi:protein TonB